MNKLYSCLFGSRLYGTQTPTSDLDWKHVVLPDLDDLLIGRGVKNSFKKTNNQKNVRNTADDVDEEFIPLQVFARDFMEGQTYALELAFSVEGLHATQSFFEEKAQVPVQLGDYSRFYNKEPLFYEFVKELRSKFLTSNIKAMMGYVVNQASLYSFKGERLNAVRIVGLVLSHANEYYGNAGDDMSKFALGDLYSIPRFKEMFDYIAVKFPKYFRVDEYDIGGDRTKPCFYLLEKCLPHTNSWETTNSTVSNLEKKYGSRAEQASESNVDWKATMHAVRIVDEGLQLLTHHKLSFPFEQTYVDRLLAMKRGELPLDPIKEELSTKLERLKELEQTTTLPSANELRAEFEVWLKGWMRTFYNINGTN